ncbi:chromate transporter [Neobacillus mesonae]|nr:chromate transporter [Neobacillus mesonae]
MLWVLFITFLKIGLVSFGGGYAVIPMIQFEVESHGWLSHTEYQEIISLAGMAPGPIATNSATLIGYETAGIAGAVVSTLGMILPSLAAVILLASILLGHRESRWFKSVFYGLRPIVTGLIIYAGIHFGMMNDQITGLNWGTLVTLFIGICSLIALAKYKLNPIAVIAIAGAAGIILF